MVYNNIKCFSESLVEFPQRAEAIHKKGNMI